MTPRWFRRRKTAVRREPAGQPKGISLDGCALLLQRLDHFEEADILDALAQRYELKTLDEEEGIFRVVIDDAYDSDEAVVRLTIVLDEIDRDWEGRFGWPKAEP